MFVCFVFLCFFRVFWRLVSLCVSVSVRVRVRVRVCVRARVCVRVIGDHRLTWRARSRCTRRLSRSSAVLVER